MRKFQFRLEAVERHRKLQEQEKQVWLAKCLERMRGTEKKLLDLDMREVQARREFSALGSADRKDPATANKFWMLDQFIRGQKVRRLELQRQLQEEEIEVGSAYKAFLHARQQRKIMEKLREKKMDQYSDELSKHDARLQDELYVTRNRLRAEEDREDGGSDEE